MLHDELDINFGNLKAFLRGDRSLYSSIILLFGGSLVLNFLLLLPAGILSVVFEYNVVENWLFHNDGRLFFVFPFQILALLIIWRCSKNVGRIFWCYVSRVVVVIVFLLLLAEILGKFIVE